MADETHKNGQTPSTVVHLTRSEGSEHEGSVMASSSPQADGGVGETRGPYLLGVLTSIVWLGVCLTWGSMTLGVSGVMVLPPQDMAALVGAAFVPLAFLWLGVAYVDRGASIRREAKALRAQLALLTYPADAGRQRVETIAESLRAQSRALSNATRDAAAQAESMRLTLFRERRELSQLNAQIEDETCQALAKVGREVHGLNAMMGQITDAANDADHTLRVRQQALEEAAKTAHETAERVVHLLHERSETLISSMGAQADRVTSALLERMRAVGDSLRHQGEALGLQSQKAVETIRTEGAAATSAVEHSLVVLGEALSQKAADMTALVDQQTSSLASTMEQRTAGFVSTLTRQGSELAESLDRHMALLATSLQHHHGGLSELSDALSTQVGVVDDLLVRQKAQSARSQEATEAMTEASEILSSTVETVSRAVAKRVLSFEDASNALMQQGRGVCGELQASLAQAQQSGDVLLKRTEDLAEGNRKIAQTAHLATQELDAATAAVLGDCATFRDAATDVLDGARTSATALRDLTVQADDVRRLLTSQTKGLEQAACALGEMVQTSTASVNEQEEAIEHAVDKAGERIRHMADLLARNAVDITRTTARATVEIEAVSEALKGRLQDVQDTAKTVKGVTEEMSQRGDQALSVLKGVSQAVENGSAQIADASTAFDQQAQRLGETARGALSALERLEQDMRGVTGQLFSSADAALSQTQTLRNTLEATLETFEAGVQRGTDRVDSSGERVRISAEVLEATARHAAETMEVVGDDLERRLKGLHQGAQSALLKVENVGASLGERQEQMERASTRAGHVSQQAGQDILKQTELLVGAADLAHKRAQELQTVRERADMQKFLHETSYIIEKLQAAAVDITRLFSPAVEEDLWKRFYKGEQNVFLRHAARTLTRRQAAAMKKVFVQNDEFRQYALRYMGEYESVLKAARLNDRADVLMAIFTSSDMGRLYTTLARATDRVVTSE